MYVINLGSQGIHVKGKLFPPGVSLEVQDEVGMYLLKKFNNKKMAIYFQKALDVPDLHKVIEQDEKPIAKPVPVIAKPKAKRGRKKKIR